MSDWIPVTERLPEDDKPVLTCDAGDAMEIMARDSARQGWTWEADNAFFYDSMLKGTDGEIVAWQPLPEPYREEP